MNLDRIREVIKWVNSNILSAGYEYDCIEVRWEAKERILRIYIDSPSGIAIDDCVKVSNILGQDSQLDQLVSGSYRLEVSSPGIERPLRFSKHFKQVIGQIIKIKFTEKVQNQKQVVGKLVEVSDSGVVTVEALTGRLSCSIENISKANVVHEWD